MIDIDQSPIGRTPRSNPATYTGAFTPIREWFAGLPEAKARGYEPGRFSFNVKGGRCEACQGDGVIKIEMHFLPDVYVTCDVCKGKRYNRETLEVKFKDKSVADVLDMTVEEGAEFFKAVPSIRDKLETLARVGLGYIHIGQQATTLSGGEAQRIKLAKELSRRATGRTLYILDEPTTGLHFHDVAKLLEVLHELADAGNTVVVIEHNLEVIKTADWVIDMGPEGGDGGGRIVAEGTPEDVAKVKESYTGQYLKELLGRRRSAASVRRPSKARRALVSTAPVELVDELASGGHHHGVEVQLEDGRDAGFGARGLAVVRIADLAAPEPSPVHGHFQAAAEEPAAGLVACQMRPIRQFVAGIAVAQSRPCEVRSRVADTPIVEDVRRHQPAEAGAKKPGPVVAGVAVVNTASLVLPSMSETRS